LVEVVGFEELVDLRVAEGRARRLYDPNRVLQGKAGHLWRGRSNQFDPGEVFRTDDLAAEAGTVSEFRCSDASVAEQ
jgi:hypothetical protein